MTRFIIIAMLWMGVSFALLWWVQTAVDGFHRHAAEAVGRGISFDPAPPQVLPPPPPTSAAEGEDDAARALAQALRPKHTSPEDLAQLEFDRRELMRRLRVLWITLTLAPVLVGAWWVVRGTNRKSEGTGRTG